jgi:hypothetical protein
MEFEFFEKRSHLIALAAVLIGDNQDERVNFLFCGGGHDLEGI